MFTRDAGAVAVLMAVLAGTAAAATVLPPGEPATPARIAPWNIDVEPDGSGLPHGSGSVAQGAALYAARCASCHGVNLEGRAIPGQHAFPALTGGAGTLAGPHPTKTVGSYWPYATTLFDYIRRAMPFDHPQTLAPDEVYALTAFILARNGIVPASTRLDAKSLPRVVMPNHDGFFINHTAGGIGAH